MHLSPLTTWLPPPTDMTPHTKQRTRPCGGLVSCRSCIALGGFSAYIACMLTRATQEMGVRLLLAIPSSGCDVTGHRGFSTQDRRLKA